MPTTQKKLQNKTFHWSSPFAGQSDQLHQDDLDKKNKQLRLKQQRIFHPI